jgi:cytochrome c biogenesis protein CcmG/thiol:disulfide interchange protein DsbE
MPPENIFADFPMWYYFAPGLAFLLLTSLLLFFVTLTEPDSIGGRDISGLKAPAFQAESLTANEPLPNPSLLAASIGKPVLINFFASWCTPCEAEMPFLRQLKKDYDLTMIGIAWNDRREKLEPWLIAQDAPYHFSGLDDGHTAEKYGVRGLPASFLLDRSGTVIWSLMGPITPEVMERELKPLLMARSTRIIEN